MKEELPKLEPIDLLGERDLYIAPLSQERYPYSKKTAASTEQSLFQ